MHRIQLEDDMEYSELEAEIIQIGERSRSRFVETVYQGVDDSQLMRARNNFLASTFCTGFFL